MAAAEIIMPIVEPVASQVPAKMNPLEMPTIIWRVVKYLDKQCVRNLRLINTQWNSEITKSRIPAEFKLIYDGLFENPSTLNYKKQILLQSGIPWKTFQFENMDFDNAYVRSALDVVLINYVSRCHSISLINCTIQMSDFIDMIARANQIRELRIEQCPSLLSAGCNILEQWKFMPRFLNNIKKIKCLSLVNLTAQEHLKTAIEIWLREACQLEVLTLETAESPMRCYVMSRILTNNFATLIRISISAFHFDRYTLDDINQISCPNLNYFELVRCRIETPLLFTEFLRNQPSLEALTFEGMELSSLTLSSIQLSLRLSLIHLFNCTYDSDSLEHLKHSGSLEEIVVEGNDQTSAILRSFIIRDNELAQHQMEALDISLTTQFARPRYDWISYIPMTFPNLVKLSLRRLRSFQPSFLRRILELPKLEVLELPDCELYDGAFTDLSIPLKPAFHKLRCLNILGTEITDESINIIAQMDSLRLLNLCGTKVTKGCLKILYEAAATFRLEFLNIRRIEDDYFSPEEFAGVYNDMFQIDAKFYGDVEGLEDTEEFEGIGELAEEYYPEVEFEEIEEPSEEYYPDPEVELDPEENDSYFS